LALARVGKQPPSSTPTSLPVRTSWESAQSPTTDGSSVNREAAV
jgi:hypothetical protein